MQMNENDEGTPTGDTTMQLNWIPQRSVGSAEVEIEAHNSDVENAGAEFKRLNRRLEALEEREAVDGREQIRKNLSRIRLKVPILKSIEVEDYRGWNKNLFWCSECRQIP